MAISGRGLAEKVDKVLLISQCSEKFALGQCTGYWVIFHYPLVIKALAYTYPQICLEP